VTPKVHLFVYGTLQRGQTAHALLAGQEFVREACTLPLYRLYDRGRHPCLVEDRELGEAVQGEIWRIDADLLATLDDYEEAGDLFERREIQIADFDGAPVQAYFYKGEVSTMRSCGSRWPAQGTCS
jgi:gamma-glutamylcyclotransferase (GGCT)/AIG2-like uncharacterized protein YtfP